jgi:hypothetical protein
MRETRRGEDEATFGKFDVMVDEGRLLGEHDVGQRFFLVREGVQVHAFAAKQKPFRRRQLV